MSSNADVSRAATSEQPAGIQMLATSAPAKASTQEQPQETRAMRIRGGGAAKDCFLAALDCFICFESCKVCCECAADIICCPCEMCC
ncbi:hypothetical protein SCHPADRAFT_937638 [Schizopora paradoxa]|uniref:Uncharacterized protein n=1 Tax=Schizopora paradoxa TaxID=27342 RepID=A0A0H2RYS9_9AGAM|nr:hypothetical protein SCHPADRAFT_937638 [Schizopora paradoxa]